MIIIMIQHVIRLNYIYAYMENGNITGKTYKI